MCLNELAERFIAEKTMKRAPATARNYRWRLSKFLVVHGDKQPKKLKMEDLEGFVLALRSSKCLAGESVNAIVQGIKAFVYWLNRHGYIKEPIQDAISRQKPRDIRKAKPTNGKTVKLMLELAPTFRDQVIITMAADTAARLGEIATLLIDNIDFDKCRALVTGKTGTRFITFTQHTRDMALDYYQNHRPKVAHNYMFCSHYRPHGPLQPASIYYMTRRIRSKMDNPPGPTNPHSFRHWVCQVYARGGDINLAKEKLGHENVTTTLGYVHNDIDYLQSQDERLSPLNDL